MVTRPRTSHSTLVSKTVTGVIRSEAKLSVVWLHHRMDSWDAQKSPGARCPQATGKLDAGVNLSGGMHTTAHAGMQRFHRCLIECKLLGQLELVRFGAGRFMHLMHGGD